jgi:hypothetical protein
VPIPISLRNGVRIMGLFGILSLSDGPMPGIICSAGHSSIWGFAARHGNGNSVGWTFSVAIVRLGRSKSALTRASESRWNAEPIRLATAVPKAIRREFGACDLAFLKCVFQPR